MATKSQSQKEEDALKDFIKNSGITLSEARLMLQELRNSAEDRAINTEVGDEREFDKGGLATKKYVNPVKVVDNRKNI